MFKKLFQKSSPREPKQSPSPPPHQGSLNAADLDPRVVVHYGIPTTASVLAFDPIQSLLAIGTLDGRIKVIGGNNIEGLLMSPKQLPFKNLEFLQNQGLLVSISSENDIQVWDLKHRHLAFSLHWESNITAFSVIHYSSYMCIGDEYGAIYLLKYDASEGKLVNLPYQISPDLLGEAAGVSLSDQHSVVGVLSQPCSHGNRFVIAYDNGLIILWDASDDHAVLVRGNKDLQLNDSLVAESHEGTHHELSDTTLDEDFLDKEISSLCWASNDGSILAVGYVDGDIMLWNLSTAEAHTTKKSSQKVVKLQLSASSRRLPVIILRWSENNLGHDDGGCRLFVYGGDEIGSEEVLTILSLDLSTGTESLKCLSRADLSLNGSFADMILLSNSGEVQGKDYLFVLTNPGQLHVYDDACLATLMSQQEKKSPLSTMQYPMVIPTIEPCMTVGKHGLIPQHVNLFKIVSANKLQTDSSTEGISKWPLTGGAHSQFYDPETYQIERVYIAGYHDGSVRIWDAMSPVLSLIYCIESKVKNVKVSGISAPISALDLCTYTSNLAAGNQHGLVCLYNLTESSTENDFHVITENGNEVHKLQLENEPQRVAVFSILSSPVRNLQFAKSGARLVVGYDCGQVAMLDTSTPSVLFLTNCLSNSTSPVISLSVKPVQQPDDMRRSPKDYEDNDSMNYVGNEVILVSNQKGDVFLLDSTSGNVISSKSVGSKESTAVRLHILEDSNYFQEAFNGKYLPKLSLENEAENEHEQAVLQSKRTLPQLDVTSISTRLAETLPDTTVLLCFENELILCPLESIFQDVKNCSRKVTLNKPCCWTTTFKKDKKECGLAVLYKNGVMEIRSLPNLDALQEFSLMSILRWSFKTNMEKTVCSSESGQLALVSGCEFAVMSLLASENDMRIPESLPLLYDEVFAAATDSTVGLLANEKRKQGSAAGFMDNIIKGFKADKVEHNIDSAEVLRKYLAHLERIFSRSPLERILSKSPILESPDAINDDKDVIELNIDDIEIDEPVHVSSSSMQLDNNNKKGKETERERLFEGSTTDTEPRARTVAEIKAKYKKTGDASAAASQARDKLMERQEKLERLSKRTEELQDGAQNFASLAHELAKNMEKRKWWNI